MPEIISFITTTNNFTVWEFLILCLSSYITSTITASFGLGGGALLILIMVNILNPLAIVPVHAVIQISSNSTRAVMLREHIDLKYFTPFIFGSLIGVSIAGIILIDLPKHIIQSLIGIFILYSIYVPQSRNIKISNKSIGLIGLISSFLTMFIGASGPIMAPFIKSFTKNRQSTVATQAAFMTWKHGIKIIVFIFLGFSFSEYIYLIIAMIIFGIFGTWTGKKILTNINEKIFGRVFYFILTILAIRLIYEGLIQFINFI